MTHGSSAWERIKWLLAVAFFVAAALLLYRHAREIEWIQVWDALGALSPAELGKGLAFTAFAFLAFGSYDLLARRLLLHGLPPVRTLAIAMTAFAMNLNLGPLVGGWASRFRLYSRAGVEAVTTAKIIGLGLLGNWSGYVLIAGACFAFFPPELPGSWTPAPVALRITGSLLLLLMLAYLLLCVFSARSRYRIRRFELQIPTFGFAACQIGASVVHWLSVCAVIKTFLPAELPFATVLGVLMMSSISGAATHVPAGLGVIEAVFLSALGHRFPASQLLAALLAYRATFYLAPFALGLIAFAVLEFQGRRSAGIERPVNGNLGTTTGK